MVAVFHLATSIYFVAMAFMDTMSRLNTAGGETAGQRITELLARILTFPLVWLLDLVPAAGEDRTLVTVVVCANSLVWGAVVYTGFYWLLRRLKARRSVVPINPPANS